ncbi:hypothetical protein [Methylocaldum marinum]|uniref:hypothetical protein n=1 Tax=Methylocaldum marinum TaxID=1432792 RepID=UPI0011AEB98C|nr:hypothetical protein [Methylocaldum marinum]
MKVSIASDGEFAVNATTWVLPVSIKQRTSKEWRVDFTFIDFLLDVEISSRIAQQNQSGRHSQHRHCHAREKPVTARYWFIGESFR